MNEKICFKKSIIILALVGVIIVMFAVLGYKISNTSTSTSSRASETTEYDPIPNGSDKTENKKIPVKRSRQP